MPSESPTNLIQELQEASRRPLYLELSISRSTGRSWSQILGDCEAHLPTLSDEQHSDLYRVLTAFFLHYLLPNYHEFYLLQNLSTRPATESQVPNTLLNLSLHERLDKLMILSSTESTSECQYAVLDPDVELGFHDLIRATRRILAIRPVPRDHVDFLHLLAMAIDPLPHKRPATDLSETAQLLMRHPAALQFQIHPAWRREIVQTVKSVVFPRISSDVQSQTFRPLLHAAIPHLRASLWSLGSLQALEASMMMVAQVGHYKRLLLPEWDDLLGRLVMEAEKVSHGSVLESQICPMSAIAAILSKFVSLGCSNRREASNRRFREHATVALAEAIEVQMETWTIDRMDDETTRYPARFLASVLRAATPLFRFNPLPEPSAEPKEEEDPYDDLVQSAVNLVGHPDREVRVEAVNLLRQARRMIVKHGVSLVEKIQRHPEDTKPLVSVLSAQSSAFAETLLETVCEQMDKALRDDNVAALKLVLFQIVATVAINCPSAMDKRGDWLLDTLKSDKILPAFREQLVAAHMSCRLARVLAIRNDDTERLYVETIDGMETWSRYRLAQHALLTGHPTTAESALKTVREACESEKYILWVSILQRYALADAALLGRGAFGISACTEDLHCAMHLLPSLERCVRQNDCILFQSEFFRLRIDFLDLLTTFRFLLKESLMTGRIPSKSSRSHLSIRNLQKAFQVVGRRCFVTYLQFGPLFRYQQSRVAMLTFSRLFALLEYSTKVAFAEICNPKGVDTSKPIDFDVESTHPTNYMVGKLHQLVDQLSEQSVGIEVRSKIFVQLIDSTLTTPFPVPRDFLVPIWMQPVELHAAPVEPFVKSEETFVTGPNLGLDLRVFGSIPEALVETWQCSPSKLILWFSYVAIENEEESAPATAAPDTAETSPVTSNLLPDGRFLFELSSPLIIDVGSFKLHLTLGLRDSNGNDWEIPTIQRTAVLNVEVTR